MKMKWFPSLGFRLNRVMVYDFTEAVRVSLVRSREEALELGHSYVGTEHILLGILSAERGVARDMFTRLGVDKREMAQKLRETVRSCKPGREISVPIFRIHRWRRRCSSCR